MTSPPSESETLESITLEAQALQNVFNTVQMATLSPTGDPEASYTPYVYADSSFYIFISGLAGHHQNIVAHPKLSLFFVENEAESKNLFARRRLSILCHATRVSKETEEWTAKLDLFQDKFGNTIELLRGLGDFDLFKLTPIKGQFVKGFGRAYTLDSSLSATAQITGK